MRTNKGTFDKGNQVAKKENKKQIGSFYAKSVASQEKVISEKKETETNSEDYIPFGTDNQFPQKATELFRRSAVVRSVVLSKRAYVVGKGFKTEDANFMAWNPNATETTEDLLLKLSLDKLNVGNAYIEIVKSNGVVNMYHKDATTARLKKGGEAIIFHPDWKKFKGNEKLSKILPLYPKFERIDGFERSVLHIKDYEPEFSHYGIPSNIGGVDSANINYKTNRWNLSRLDNAFSVSGVMNIKANFSTEDAKSFKEDLNNAFTGDGNAGKVLTIVDEQGAENGGTSFTPIQQNEEGNWLTLHERATEEILISNQWFGSLAGLQISSGFDTNRIKNDYQIAMSTVIPYEQRFFIEAFYKVIKEQIGWDLLDLSIENESPIDEEKEIYAYHIDSGVVSINEARERLGFAPIEDPNEQKNKELKEQLSLLNLATSAGMSIEDARKLIGI